MKISEQFSNLRKNELLLGSLILIILINIGNLFSYLFQFIMARMLGPADYGTLAVLTSIVGIFGIPTLAIQTIMAKNTTRLNVSRSFGKIKYILKYASGRVMLLSLITYIIFLLVSIPLSIKLNISFWLLALAGIFIFAAFIYPMLSGILQGMKKFTAMGISFFVNCFVKFAFGILLVAVSLRLYGTGLYGAAMGFILGAVFSILIVFPYIKEITSAKEEPEKFKIRSAENFYYFAAMLIFVLMYSLDVFFAKAFFDAETAGKYAVVSMIGKIILFVIMAISSVMFPINTERHMQNKATNIISKTYFMAFLISAASIILVYFFPDLIIGILFGKQYLSLSNILIYVCLAFIFLSFLNISILHKISTERFGKTDIILLMLFFAVEIALFAIFRDIENFSMAFMASSAIAFLGGIVFSKR